MRLKHEPLQGWNMVDPEMSWPKLFLDSLFCASHPRNFLVSQDDVGHIESDGGKRADMMKDGYVSTFRPTTVLVRVAKPSYFSKLLSADIHPLMYSLIVLLRLLS